LCLASDSKTHNRTFDSGQTVKGIRSLASRGEQRVLRAARRGRSAARAAGRAPGNVLGRSSSFMCDRQKARYAVQNIDSRSAVIAFGGEATATIISKRQPRPERRHRRFAARCRKHDQPCRYAPFRLSPRQLTCILDDGPKGTPDVAWVEEHPGVSYVLQQSRAEYAQVRS
jgi:hypothetical protein